MNPFKFSFFPRKLDSPDAQATRGEEKQKRGPLSFLLFLVILIIAYLYLFSYFFQWNHSISLPIGLYARCNYGNSPALGSFVVITDSTRTRNEGVNQFNLQPLNGKLVKRIIGTEGQEYCLDNYHLQTKDRYLIIVPFPNITQQKKGGKGCRKIPKDSILIAGDHFYSYDSRYFGILSTSDIDHEVCPFFTF